jgi:hypothetical protein
MKRALFLSFSFPFLFLFFSYSFPFFSFLFLSFPFFPVYPLESGIVRWMMRYPINLSSFVVTQSTRSLTALSAGEGEKVKGNKDLGRMINARHVQRVSRLVESSQVI